MSDENIEESFSGALQDICGFLSFPIKDKFSLATRVGPFMPFNGVFEEMDFPKKFLDA